MLDVVTTALNTAAQAVHDLPVDHLFTLHLELTKHVLVPAGPEGATLHLGIIDGSFSGNELIGRVAPLVGHTTAVLRGDGYARSSYCFVLVTDDHDVVTVDGAGIVQLSEPYESRVAFNFHTAEGRLGWLNHVQGVAVGRGGRDEATFEVYRMR
jgi:hypothetical protein